MPAWFGGLLLASLQATFLAGMVLAVRRLFRRRLAAKWTHLLFVLVLIRLTAPVLPSSPLSLFNLVPRPAPAAAPAAPAVPTANPSPSPSEPRFADGTGLSDRSDASDASDGWRGLPVPASAPAPRPTGWDIAFLAWAVGLAALALQLVVRNARFAWRLARDASPCPRKVQE